ncbi:MAG: 1-deoxy-D-xylulose-5-phosphate reductoisomerase, partial [Candidatus Hydrogenedentes bacterium]|nr:1-deoxy-D-xylulose-5-phosphate reductoisomerase [Candidatus Hydrogenedentota bacterium]
TIDSATLMNKALEVIEAHWLFGLSAEQIEVVIHPQSIVHAMVEFCDGSVIAQLANPDMKGPIAYALHYPDRPQRETASLDFSSVSKLEFRPVTGRFARALELGYEVIRRGGASGAVMNAANETAVEAFLAGKMPFGRIVPIVEQVLEDWGDSQDFSRDASDSADKSVTLNTLLDADAWARQQTAAALSCRQEKNPVLGLANQQMN